MVSPDFGRKSLEIERAGLSHEKATTAAAKEVRSLPPCGGGSGRGVLSREFND